MTFQKLHCALTAAALLAASPAFSETGNCFRLTTKEEQSAGLPTVTQVELCDSSSDHDFCLRRAGRDILRPDLEERYVPVDRCTKSDKFDEEEKP